MTEGGLGSIRLDAMKLLGYHKHQPNTKLSNDAVSVSDTHLDQMSNMADVGSVLEVNLKSEFSSNQAPEELIEMRYLDDSQASADIELVWLNFASPRNLASESIKEATISEPLSNLTLDYNLLTTGTFTLTAWLKQFEEIKDKMQKLDGKVKMRNSSVLAVAMYMFLFEQDDYDIRAPTCEFEMHLLPISRKLREDFTLRTLIKLFRKLPNADVAVMDYTLQRNSLSLEIIHRALFIMCQILIEHELSTSQPRAQASKASRFINAFSRNAGTSGKTRKGYHCGKKEKNKTRSALETPEEETMIRINIEQFDESSNAKSFVDGEISEFDDEIQNTTGISIIEEETENLSKPRGRRGSKLSVGGRKSPIRRLRDDPLKSMMSKKSAKNERQPLTRMYSTRTNVSVLPDGIEIAEPGSNSGCYASYNYSGNVRGGFHADKNMDQVSVASVRSLAFSLAESEKAEMAKRKGRSRRLSLKHTVGYQQVFTSFKALLQAINAYRNYFPPC